MPFPRSPATPPEQPEKEPDSQQSGTWWDIAFEAVAFVLELAVQVVVGAFGFVWRIVAGLAALVLESCS
ncbi:MAG: hypothetical protein AB7O57_17780 [Hyphomicrobiaceae bacterium]